MPRFNKVVATSFGISIMLMCGITAVGYLTFGSSCSGLILNNYSTKDLWMGASRVAVAVSLVFSYPLAFQGCRDGILDLLQVPDEQRRKNSFLNLTTVCLLTAITLLAATLKDVSFVLAFGGGM
jgi:amino acid permease